MKEQSDPPILERTFLDGFTSVTLRVVVWASGPRRSRQARGTSCGSTVKNHSATSTPPHRSGPPPTRSHAAPGAVGTGPAAEPAVTGVDERGAPLPGMS